jgi:hypothetical protein
MKKLIVALALFTSLAVSAELKDWSVLSGPPTVNSTLAYTIIPSTVESVQTNTGPETWIVVEVFQVGTPTDIVRRRIRTTGCNVGTGKTTMANMDGSFIKENPVWDWDKGGDKIYDQIAIQSCVAEMAKKKAPEMKKQSNQGPNV